MKIQTIVTTLPIFRYRNWFCYNKWTSAESPLDSGITKSRIGCRVLEILILFRSFICN
jgi:hypothetical protein